MFSRLTKSEVFPGDFNGLPQIWRFNQPFFPAFSDLVSQKIFRCFISAVGSLVAHLACESPCPPKTYCTQRLSGFGCSLWNTHRYGVGCFWGAKYIRLVRSGDNLSAFPEKSPRTKRRLLKVWAVRLRFGAYNTSLNPGQYNQKMSLDWYVSL